jgi:hypothetical protein
MLPKEVHPLGKQTQLRQCFALAEYVDIANQALLLVCRNMHGRCDVDADQSFKT